MIVSPRVALLIDADNAKLNLTPQIRQIAESYGALTICRAYGDWNQSPLSSWRKKVTGSNINPIQQNRIGKNSTDHRLLIEAGELLGGEKADVFIIVTGDADFTSLCGRIKELGKRVIGMGGRKQTSTVLRKSCHEFMYLEDIASKLGELNLLT